MTTQNQTDTIERATTKPNTKPILTVEKYQYLTKLAPRPAHMSAEPFISNLALCHHRSPAASRDLSAGLFRQAASVRCVLHLPASADVRPTSNFPSVIGPDLAPPGTRAQGHQFVPGASRYWK